MYSSAPLFTHLSVTVPAATTLPTKVLTLTGPIEAVACTTGALSGALHASRRNLDVLGVIAVALCTGVGGGAIRDVMLNTGIPVFLVTSTLLLYALFAAALGALFASLVHRFTPILAVIDTFLIGVWVVIGVQKSLLVGLAPTAALFVGVVACIGGGLLRDILCRERPEVLSPSTFYAAAAVAGASAYLILAQVGAPVWASTTATILVAAALRGASAYYGWETPRSPAVSSPGATELSTE